MVCFCFLLGFSTIFLRSLIPDCGGLVDSTSESEPEVVDSNFIGAVFCVFSAVVGSYAELGVLGTRVWLFLGLRTCDSVMR